MTSVPLNGPIRLHLIGCARTVFANLYARDDDGNVYVGTQAASDRDRTECETFLGDLVWTSYAKSRAPRWVASAPAQAIIDLRTDPPTVTTPR